MEANRKSRFGWMAVGALLCLAALAALVRLQSSNTARAQGEMVGPKLPELPKKAKAPGPLPMLDVSLPPLPSTDAPPLADIVPAKAEVPAPAPPAPPLPGSEALPIQIPGAPLVPMAPPVSGTALPPIPAAAPVVSPVPAAPVVPAEVVPVVSRPAPLPTAASTPMPGTENKVPCIKYRVRTEGMTVKTLARRTLGTVERWQEVCKLNPSLNTDKPLVVGTTVSLPQDAVVSIEEALRPLPALRSRPAPKRRAALPLTGTYPAKLDANGMLVLPEAVLAQLGRCSTVLLSPGSDRCLWLTNQAHLDRLGAKLDKSPARHEDIRSFRRLYYAQTVKVAVKDKKAPINDRLATFAGLTEDVVLVGIDDHFEVWDATKWRHYTDVKKAGAVTE